MRRTGSRGRKEPRQAAQCADCGQRPPKFRSSSAGKKHPKAARYRKDPQHTVCTRCNGSMVDRSHARKLKLREADNGAT